MVTLGAAAGPSKVQKLLYSREFRVNLQLGTRVALMEAREQENTNDKQ